MAMVTGLLSWEDLNCSVLYLGHSFFHMQYSRNFKKKLTKTTATDFSIMTYG